jgi:hypothetical protein
MVWMNVRVGLGQCSGMEERKYEMVRGLLSWTYRYDENFLGILELHGF